jgi:septal ring factor EnvC (AmiA/AmiB activator)
MSAIVPPLDFIPKLPAKAVDLTIKQIDTQTDKLLEQVTKTVQDSIKLPVNIKCDDPRIKKIKKQLTDIQKQLTTVQENIPKIQKTVDTVKNVVGIAQGIKTAISIAQLSNPVTAPLFIAQQLTAIQDATIVNAIESLNQFATVPASLTSKLQTLVPPLLAAISKVSAVCNGDVDNLEIPSSLLPDSDTDTDYNDLVATEFYNKKNVSQSDLDDRSDSIEQLLRQQRDLLTSLIEAPSKVYQNSGVPANDLGKAGDYYIDLDTQTIYGPKASLTQW